MDNYEQQRTMSLLGLRAFPRSMGMLGGAIALLLTKNPVNALIICIVIWFITYLVKSMLPATIVDTNLWSCCSLPVNAIGAYPIRWSVFIILVIAAVIMGAPWVESLAAMGVLLVYDMFIVFTRGS